MISEPKDSVCRLHTILQQAFLVHIITAAENATKQNSSSNEMNRPQWPRRLIRGSAAARFLGLWVRTPGRAWIFLVIVLCCHVEVPASGWSLFQRSPTECGVMIEGKRKPLNTFAASYLNTQGLNNSCLKSPASTLVNLTFQSRTLRSFSLNQLRKLSL